MEVDDDSVSLTVNDENRRPPVVTESELVAKKLQFAKLDLDSLNPLVQQVYFGKTLKQDEIKLLELNTETHSYFESGGKLVLKGNATENCVICTGDKSFEVKGAEISNSLLLVRDADLDLGQTTTASPQPQPDGGAVDQLQLNKITVDAICHSYLELRPCKPRMQHLSTLLTPSIFDGPENNDDSGDKLLALNDILASVPASDGEIHQALFLLHAIDMEGYIRLISFDYLSRVANSVIDLIDENSWSYDNFSQKVTLETLSELYPRQVILHVLEFYGSPKQSSVNCGAADAWCLNEDRICRYYAEMLLKPTKKFNLEEFLVAWKESVPEGMITSIPQLNGMAFADRSSEPAVMRYFPVEQLSEDVKVRFQELFNAKSAWTLEEISPYVEPLCAGKQTVSVIVMKNARAFTKAGTKYYTSKYNN